jgi:hypothetical protein
MNALSNIFLLASIFMTTGRAHASGPITSHFLCKELSTGGRFKPYYMQAIEDGTRYKDYSNIPKGLLGQNSMSSLSECTQAIEAANNTFGIICSRTGLNGWKPTIYTGGLPGRSDFGYLGGSSIMEFSDCLAVTTAASSRGVCFWGGADWYVSPVERAGVSSGPYRSLAACIAQTANE